MAKYKAYPEYKDSGVIFLDNPPSHWHTMKIKHLLKLKNEIVGNNHINLTLLSLTLNGVITRDISSGEGKIPESFATYQRVETNDLIFCLFDMDETPRTVGLSSQGGMITGAYNVYDCNNKADPLFLYYYFLHIDSFKRLKPYYTGLRKVVRSETFYSLKLHLPSIKEQSKIAIYLGHQITNIDNLIEKQLQFIELLKEKRQALISHAVTKGLNPDVPMKDSGIEWLGKIPTHWIVCHLKQLAKIRNGQDYKSIESETGFPVIGSGGQFAYAKNYIYDKPSVLLGRKGTIDKPLYIDSCFWAVDTMFYTEVNKNIIAKYLYYISTTIQFDKYSTNTALPSMTQENLGNYSLCYSLDPDEQQNIVDFIELKTNKIDTLIQKQLQQIYLLKERRTALISAAVTGKIDLRDWTPPASSSEASLSAEEATA